MRQGDGRKTRDLSRVNRQMHKQRTEGSRLVVKVPQSLKQNNYDVGVMDLIMDRESPINYFSKNLLTYNVT